jgi:hypothetical protein
VKALVDQAAHVFAAGGLVPDAVEERLDGVSFVFEYPPAATDALRGARSATGWRPSTGAVVTCSADGTLATSLYLADCLSWYPEHPSYSGLLTALGRVSGFFGDLDRMRAELEAWGRRATDGAAPPRPVERRKPRLVAPADAPLAKAIPRPSADGPGLRKAEPPPPPESTEVAV